MLYTHILYDAKVYLCAWAHCMGMIIRKLSWTDLNIAWFGESVYYYYKISYYIPEHLQIYIYIYEIFIYISVHVK